MKSFWKSVTSWALTLHIYISMAGFVLILLFAVTGLTLNHADFGLSTPRTETQDIRLPPSWAEAPSKETMVSEVRRILNVNAPLTSYNEFPEEIDLLFESPGKRTHVIINRLDETAWVEHEKRGILGAIGDLHKGDNSGTFWFWLIDIAAVLLTISSLTGLITLASLPARRRGGFLIGAAAVLLLIVSYIVWVPA